MRSAFNDRNHNGITRRRQASSGDIPRLFALDVLVPPLLAVLRIVRDAPLGDRVVVLCELDAGWFAKARNIAAWFMAAVSNWKSQARIGAEISSTARTPVVAPCTCARSAAILFADSPVRVITMISPGTMAAGIGDHRNGREQEQEEIFLHQLEHASKIDGRSGKFVACGQARMLLYLEGCAYRSVEISLFYRLTTTRTMPWSVPVA